MTLLLSACRPDADAEWDHLRGLLPGDGNPARPQAEAPLPATAGCDVLAWATSGLMYLTGCPDAAPRGPAAPVLSRARVLAAMIAELSATAGREVRLDVPNLLAGRARLHGWQRRGTVSANGSCRMLRAADGWLAVNLARPDDVRSVPAVLRGPVRGDAWAALAQHAGTRPAAGVAAEAQAVGIPAAALGSARAEPLRLSRPGVSQPSMNLPGVSQEDLCQPGRNRAALSAPPLVLDLSAMWAGPVCARILRDAGWRVLKAEDSRRPDGARFGPPQFYADLHAGIPAVRLDFGTAAGRAALARLAGQASVVIESSRPRALRNLGLLAEEWLAAVPGRIWVSITGYGRDDPQQRVAFGDDAAVAGGLVALTGEGSPDFCGDAIADPLTGMLAGAAALAATADGGGWLLDVAMAGVCADLARPGAAVPIPHPVCRDAAGWTVWHGDASASVLA